MRLVDVVQAIVRSAGYDVVRYRAERIHKPFDLLGLLIRDELTRTAVFTFMQVGANDGLSDDHLRRSILRHHLRGLLVEPIPDLFDALKRNYAGQSGLLFEQCAIADRDGTVPMYRIRKDAPLPPSVQQLASFTRHHLTTGRQGVPGLDAHIEQISVPARSLQSLVTQYELSNLTALIIDAEGYDGVIVRRALADGLRPRLLMYEHANLQPDEQATCLKLLIHHGYRFVEVGMDTYAVANAD